MSLEEINKVVHECANDCQKLTYKVYKKLKFIVV